MRRLRIAVLMLPLVLLAATCVTSITQRGPGGPWIAVVTNTSDQPINGVAVRARITDSAGRDFGIATAFTCPSTVPAHGSAVGEIFFPDYVRGDIALPLHAEFERVPLTQQFGFAGPATLTARVLDTDRGAGFAVVEVRNGGATPVHDAQICAVLRGPDGVPLEVAYTALFPTQLRPGDLQTLALVFHSMPEGSMDLYPIGSDVCCPGTLLLDPTQVHVETKRITGTGGNRRLNIAASLTNTTGQDITRVRIMAAVAGAPQTRTEASVACGSSVIGLRAAAPVTVSIPVPEGVIDAEVDILGVEAEPASSQLALPVSDVSFSSFAFIEGTMAVRVTATVRNSPGCSRQRA